MSLEALRQALPEYAKDQRLNLGTLAAEPSLTARQRAGCFVVAALASRNPEVIRRVVAEFSADLTPEALVAAKTAASIMAMTTVYYRFTHLVGRDYAAMPARLRMNAMARPGVERADFELWALVAAAIAGCGKCMESHEAALLDHGMTREQVLQAAIRIAAVVNAVALTLEAEAALVDPAGAGFGWAPSSGAPDAAS